MFVWKRSFLSIFYCRQKKCSLIVRVSNFSYIRDGLENLKNPVWYVRRANNFYFFATQLFKIFRRIWILIYNLQIQFIQAECVECVYGTIQWRAKRNFLKGNKEKNKTRRCGKSSQAKAHISAILMNRGDTRVKIDRLITVMCMAKKSFQLASLFSFIALYTSRHLLYIPTVSLQRLSRAKSYVIDFHYTAPHIDIA